MKELYSGGKWAASGSGAASQTLNPFDASVLETVAGTSPDDVERAIAAAREAFEHVDDAAAVFSYYAGIADANPVLEGSR